MLAQLEGEGNIDQTFAGIEVEAPAVKQAQAKLEVAQRDLAQAELDLQYCDIVAEIDGVFTRLWRSARSTRFGSMRTSKRRNSATCASVRLSSFVSTCMAARMNSRVAGFTNGTGSTLALLPAENAMGNFVKVVQRLPVRIELEG